MKEFRTLDWDNALIQSEYKKLNYKINHNSSNNNLCYLYFSSNNLYKKDSESDFNNKIIEKDRFEWMNRSAEYKPSKEIFIRDIWLSWYVLGINEGINSIDKLISFLQKETEGYKVVTIGVSSGGYISSIVAAKLNAYLCFNFSGQWSLQNHFDHVKNNPFLKNSGYLECYNIVKGSTVPIVYLYPAMCEQDITQLKYAQQCDNVKVFAFKSKRHGTTVLPINLPKLLSFDKNKIADLCSKYQNKSINQLEFSIRISGVTKTVKYCLSFFAKKILKNIK